jgi:hypothetical protein
MTGRQNQWELRGRAVLSFMDMDPTKWNGSPVAVSKHDLLRDGIVAVDELVTIQEMDRKGNLQLKSYNRLRMAEKGIEIAEPLAQWAKDQGDLVLFNEVSFCFCDLLATKETTAEQRNQLVHDRALAHAAALTAGGYGVDAAAILNYQGLIEAFKNKMSAPRDGQAISMAATLSLAIKLREVNDLVKDLKRLMKPLERTGRDFFNGFMASTRLINTGIRRIYAELKLEDAETATRIPKGTVKITELDLTIPVSSNGAARIKDAETGTFTVTVESPNYETETIENFVMTGKKTARVVVKMRKGATLYHEGEITME